MRERAVRCEGENKDMERPIPQDVLIEASTHLRYEIEQFSAAAAVLRREFWADVPRYMAKTAHNALLESWTIHFRGLYDFLYAEPRDDDMSAGDWFPGGDWPSIRTGPTSLLKAARRRVNKDIAHLTYDRLKRHGEQVFWPRDGVIEDISTDLFRFQDRVDPALVSDGFRLGVWQALPWPTQDPPLVRFDPTVIQPVATTSFGIPEAGPK
jgi:hypothetical protein